MCGTLMTLFMRMQSTVGPMVGQYYYEIAVIYH